MLVLQIAVGIFLGYLLIKNYEVVFGIGIIVGTIALVIAVIGMVILGVSVFWTADIGSAKGSDVLLVVAGFILVSWIFNGWMRDSENLGDSRWVVMCRKIGGYCGAIISAISKPYSSK